MNRYSALLVLAGLLLGGCCNEDFVIPQPLPVDYDVYDAAIDLTPLINSCAADASFTTVSATPDRNTGSCWNNSGPLFNRWFKFTAPVTGSISVTIDIGGTKGTQKRSQAALWQNDGTTQVSCSRYVADDDDVVLTASGLTSGSTYYVSVDTESAATQGTFTCCLQDFIPPSVYNVFVSNVSSNNVSVVDPVGQVESTTLACIGTCSEPRNLAVSPNKLMVYVPIRHSDKVVAIDPETQTVIADITDPSFDEPYSVAFTQDSKEAWIVNKQGGGSSTGSITIINTTTRTVVGSINHVSISSPEGIAIANGMAYVANRGNGDVPVFNIATRAFVTTIDAPGTEARFAAPTPNGSFVYVTNGGQVLKIATATNTIATTIPISSGRNLTVSPDGLKVFVATQSSIIHVIDVTANTNSSIAVPGAFSIYATAISSQLNIGFATDESLNRLYLFNPTTMTLMLDGGGLPITITVGSTPRAIAAQ